MSEAFEELVSARWCACIYPENFENLEAITLVQFSGAPNDGFPPNALKTLFRQCRVLFILSSAKKIYVCLVILGQLESFRNYKGFSIIFRKILAAIYSSTKVRIFLTTLCVVFFNISNMLGEKQKQAVSTRANESNKLID